MKWDTGHTVSHFSNKTLYPHLMTKEQSSHVIGESPAGLSAIRKTGVNMAVWRRGADVRCESAIRALLAARYAVALDQDPASAAQIGAEIQSLVGRHCDSRSARALAADVWNLVGIFCGLADTNHARVRLERIEDDGCLLFHADTLRLRMLCTYAGPGTEWVENENARFDELGLRARSIEETNRAIVIDETRIRHVSPWHVAVFSGRLREDTPPLIHRSAPVRGEQDFRIRLCIDLPNGCGC